MHDDGRSGPRRRGTPRRSAHGARGGRSAPAVRTVHLRGSPGIRDLRSHADVRRPAVLGGTGARVRDGPAEPAIAPAPGCPGTPRAPQRRALRGPRRNADQAVGSSAVRFRVRFGSTGTPGPIVVEMVTFFRYRPLADDGLARSTSSSAAA